MREFTDKDIEHRDLSRIYCNKNELVYDPPEWKKKGLQETASGYGRRLNSGYKIHFNGQLYRVYVTCFSNSGTSWFKCKGKTVYLS